VAAVRSIRTSSLVHRMSYVSIASDTCNARTRELLDLYRARRNPRSLHLFRDHRYRVCRRPHRRIGFHYPTGMDPARATNVWYEKQIVGRCRQAFALLHLVRNRGARESTDAARCGARDADIRIRVGGVFWRFIRVLPVMRMHASGIYRRRERTGSCVDIMTAAPSGRGCFLLIYFAYSV